MVVELVMASAADERYIWIPDRADEWIELEASLISCVRTMFIADAYPTVCPGLLHVPSQLQLYLGLPLLISSALYFTP